MRGMFESVSTLCEIFTFTYIGLQVGSGDLLMDPCMMWSVIPLGILSRAMGILPLALVLRVALRTHISWRIQLLQVFTGMRGVMAYALAGT